MSASAKLTAELAKLNPSSVIELFILDASSAGGGILYFYNGIGAAYRPELPNQPIKFQGRSYTPMPIEVSGFEFRSKGELPRPKIKFSNVFGLFTSLVILYDDLIDATLTRKRTLRKFLDDGSDPDPTQEFETDVYFVDRKATENKRYVEFELGSAIDVDGVTLPRRKFSANICSHGYRSADCSFADNRFVTKISGVAYPTSFQISRFRGAHNLALNYLTSDAVSVFSLLTDESFYVAVQPVPPSMAITNTAYWRRYQHFRGPWNIDTIYYLSDVVYTLTRAGDRQYFILTALSATGAYSEPPNLNFWQPDQCAKSLAACKLHHDPANQGKVLPFGAFPGTNRALSA